MKMKAEPKPTPAEMLDLLISVYSQSELSEERKADWRTKGNELVEWMNQRFDNNAERMAFLDFFVFNARRRAEKEIQEIAAGVISHDFLVM